MMSADIIYEQVHFRHDPKWSVRLRSAEGSGVLLCVACAIEMMESEEMAVSITLLMESFSPSKTDIYDGIFLFSTFKLHFPRQTDYLLLHNYCFTCLLQSVRKCFALSSISGILKSSAGALRELFRQDHRVTLHFITTLLGEENMHQHIGR